MSKPVKPNLQQMSQQLSYLSQLIAQGAETASEADRFYALLDKILELPSQHESVVTALAMSGLVQLGDQDTARWLAEELDIEAQLQYMPNATGRERACLLFALPVVTPSGSSVQQHAHDTELFEELHDIVHESDVIDQAADFGLVPRLFSYAELFSRSYGELRRLTRHLGQQVLSGDTLLQLPENFEGLAPLEGPSCSPYVDLYFLVGLVTTTNEGLDGVFPPLPDEMPDEDTPAMDDDGAPRPIELTASGEFADGEPWEKPFCQAFDDAFGAIGGCLTVLPPDGLPEDLRRGLEMSREIGLLRMFEVTVPEQAQPLARLGALVYSDEGACVEVSCVLDAGAEALETMQWSVLNHETDADAMDKLMGCLEDAGIAHEFPLADFHNPLGSLMLN